MTIRAWPVLLLLLASPARAQIPTSEPVAAHMRFEEGVEHARRGDVALALAAFEAAYTIRPHFSVLYNIAQAHSALGSPVQAIATFERYLAEGGAELTESRREAVHHLIDLERQRVGQVVIHVASPGKTRIWLDGSEVGADRHELSLFLEVGDHTLLYSHGAGHPVVLAFKVVAGQTSRQHIPAPAAPPPSRRPLEIECDVPDVDVAIDGIVVASTPVLKPLLVDVGRHQVHFTRSGFSPFSVDIDVKPDSANSVGCRLRWQTHPDSSFAARLFVQPTPRDAQVFVDGFAFSGGVVPAGRHLVRVERDGYVADVRTVWVRPGAGRHHEVALTPTPAQRQRDTKRRLQRRALGTILAGGSASSLIVAGTLYVWNQRRFEELRSASHVTPGAASSGRIASIQRVDDATIGLGALSLGLAVAATWTLLADAQE